MSRAEQLAEATALLAFEHPHLAARIRPGQFLMLWPTGDGTPLLGRPFSVGDVEGRELRFYVRAYGAGTRIMCEMRAGDPLRILGPLGRGFTPVEGASRHLLVGGGIGMAPFPFLARVLREEAPEAEVVWLYGEREPRFLMDFGFLDTLGLIREKAVESEDGRRVTDLLGPYRGERWNESAVYACGPYAMLKAMALLVEGTAGSQFSMEERMACGVGACQGCAIPVHGRQLYRLGCVDGPVFQAQELRW